MRATDGDIGYLLNRAARQIRLRFAEALVETGITPQQAAALMAISRSDGGWLTPSAIAAAIDTDLASTSGLLDRLTRDGWLVAQPNPDDGRSRLFGLTAKANDALPGVLAAADRVSADALASLSPDEASSLRSLLSRLCGTPGDASKEAGSR